MATFYVGKRPVLKGRNANDPNTYTGKVGVYSNWDLMNTSHVFDGAPDNYHVPGTGYSPHGYQLSRMFTGHSDQNLENSLMSPGLGTRQDPYYFRQGPYLWKGVTAGNVFPVGFGHKLDSTRPYAYWTNYFYSGVPADQIFPVGVNWGHGQEAYGSHYAFMGPIKPYEYHGVLTYKSAPMNDTVFNARTGHKVYDPSVVADAVASDYGKIPAARATVEHYGFEHTQEWFGVPSAKAL